MSKRNIKGIGIILLMLLQAAAVRAQWESGFAVLQIGAGGRASAMGEAFTAVQGDASAAFWNPAGAADLAHFQAHLAKNEWIQDVSHDAASVLFPVKPFTLGVHAIVVSVPGIEQRYYPTEEPLSTFSAHDLVFGLTVARKIGSDVAMGANFRYLNERISSESASGFSIDLGVHYRTPLEGLAAGIMVQHLGATSDMVTQKITLPRTIRAGVAYALPLGNPEAPWQATVDFVSVQNQTSHLHVGAEIRPLVMLALRAGYQTGYDSHDLTAGFGLQLGRFEIDYAYVPFQEELGQANRFSVSIGL